MAVLAVASLAIAAPQQPGTSNATQHRGVKLTPQQRRTILAVQPWLERQKNENHALKNTAPKYAQLSQAPKAQSTQRRAKPNGANVQGWRSVKEYGNLQRGWCALDLDGTQTYKWNYHDPTWTDDGYSDEPDFPFNTGFWYKNRVYGFHGEMLYCWLVWGHGSFDLNGNIYDYQHYGDNLDVTDFSTYVISCVYYPVDNKVYAYTLNAGATGYMLRTINPDTWQFNTVVDSISIEDICIGLAYNPIDKKIYGTTPAGNFVTFNPKDGKLTPIAKLNLAVTTAMCGMTYSPLDKLFYLVYTSTSDDPAQLYTIDPKNPVPVLRASLPDVVQYRILISPDTVPSDKAPIVPHITAFNFPAGLSSGAATVLMPTKAYDGSALTGDLTLTAYVDSTPYSTTTAKAGTSVTVQYTDIADGNHTFAFSVKQGDLSSAKVDTTLYVGYDTPKAPQNIALGEGKLSWSPVTEGVNGGYIDKARLTYNVYLNSNKVNAQPIADTTYAFTMPDSVYRKYVAQVEAVNHGHASDRGFSNGIKYGNPFPLPFSMTPTQAESELLTGLGSGYDWHLSNGEYLSIYNSLSRQGEKHWFYLPAISVPDTDKLIEVSFEAKISDYGYTDNPHEVLELAYGDTQNEVSMHAIHRWNKITETDWTTYRAWFKPAAGKTYLGFAKIMNEDGNELDVRNISVKVSDRPATTPCVVTNLKAEALPQGALKAKVSFNIPTTSVDGNKLTDVQLTATVISPADTATVTGAPGSAQTIEVGTSDGLNTITAVAANAAQGIDTTTTVFTGVDAPKPLATVKVTHSEDYKSLHYTWDAPNQGANGGYVDPAKVTYAVYQYDSENYQWKLLQDLGTTRSFDYTPTVESGMAVSQLGFLSKNDKGNNGTVYVASAVSGTPYEMPISDNDFKNATHSPLIMEVPDSTYQNNGMGYGTSNRSPYGTWSLTDIQPQGTKTRLSLPSVSTMGATSAGIELTLYHGPQAAQMQIYAEAYGLPAEKIGTFSDASSVGWSKVRFNLPAKFLGKKWVNFKIDALYTAEGESYAIIAQYAIQTFYGNDIAVVEMNDGKFPMVGEAQTITARIENQGRNTMVSPVLKVDVKKDEDIIATLDMSRTHGSGDVPELGQATYEATWTPDGEAAGKITYVVRLVNADDNAANDELTDTVSVSSGHLPVVTDLEAENSNEGVLLSWTEPAVKRGTEGFENFAPFYYGSRIGDIKTVSLDSMECSYFGNFNFPYQQEAKAWQVFSDSEITKLMKAAGVENTFFHAGEGDRFVAAFTPFTVYTGSNLTSDRWLITPEIKGGSTVKFQLTSVSTGYVESVEFLYSDATDDPADFKLLEATKLLSAGWRDYSYTVPSDAKYFAIRYRGNSDSALCVMVDNIQYEPMAASPAIAGYDIYRNGSVLAENTAAPGMWIDSNFLTGRNSYNVVPVLNQDGTLSRGLKSNTAWVDTQSGVNELVASQGNIYGTQRAIVVSGLACRVARVYTIDGRLIASQHLDSDNVRIAAEQGIYVVIVDGLKAKVAVR